MNGQVQYKKCIQISKIGLIEGRKMNKLHCYIGQSKLYLLFLYPKGGEIIFNFILNIS